MRCPRLKTKKRREAMALKCPKCHGEFFEDVIKIRKNFWMIWCVKCGRAWRLLDLKKNLYSPK